MGREIRRVPANWEHPKKEGSEDYRPLCDGGFEDSLAEWIKAWGTWKKTGYAKACKEYPHYVNLGAAAAFGDWHGAPPDPSYFAPDWTKKERTHYQLYETVSEGTPLSPPMPSIKSLARWLAENHRPWGAESRNLTYDEWLRFCGVGWAPSMVMQSGVIRDGAEFVANREAAK
jgi:hypothetical protein